MPGARKPASLQLPVDAPAFAQRLLQWYRQNGRQLPWRGETDPYRVWVSEVMLQQTQVKTALPFYRRFLERFPTLQALAEAPLSDVLSEWAGLGYYNRARNLHMAAGQICREHSGRFPEDYQQALQLPGVGRYTAGAILSAVYGQSLPILDGNIRRFLARYLGIQEDIQSRSRDLWALLERLVSDPAISGQIVDFNQSLMEIGALVCRPRSPNCSECPLSGSCRGLRAGHQDQLPRTRRVTKNVEMHFVAAVIQEGSEVLMQQNRDQPFLDGFWDLPKLQIKRPLLRPAHFEKAWGLRLRVRAELEPVKHQITHHKLSFVPLLCVIIDGEIPDGWVWANPLKRERAVPAYVPKIHQRVQAWGQRLT